MRNVRCKEGQVVRDNWNGQCAFSTETNTFREPKAIYRCIIIFNYFTVGGKRVMVGTTSLQHGNEHVSLKSP